jgi:hypothetical protein
MIHLFLDDSGKDGQQTNPWVCMAGYLADYDATVSLIGKWRQLLIAHGIREIQMKHLIPLTEPYKDLRWDSAKRDSVVNDFIQAINETRMAGSVWPSRWPHGAGRKQNILNSPGGRSSNSVLNAF